MNLIHVYHTYWTYVNIILLHRMWVLGDMGKCSSEGACVDVSEVHVLN